MLFKVHAFDSFMCLAKAYTVQFAELVDKIQVKTF